MRHSLVDHEGEKGAHHHNTGGTGEREWVEEPTALQRSSVAKVATKASLRLLKGGVAHRPGEQDHGAEGKALYGGGEHKFRRVGGHVARRRSAEYDEHCNPSREQQRAKGASNPDQYLGPDSPQPPQHGHRLHQQHA